jgi:hypothetical protein
MKMPGPKGVITIKADQLDALASKNASLSHAGCYDDKVIQDQEAKTQADNAPQKTSTSKPPPTSSTPQASMESTTQMGVNTSSASAQPPADQKTDNKKKGTTEDEDNKEMVADPNDHDKKSKISSKLDPKYELVLVTFLPKNLDVFTWKILDMSGIRWEVIEHKLEIDPLIKPIKNKKERRYTPERHEAIRQEVNRLLKSGFIRPVDYPSQFLKKSLMVLNSCVSIIQV